MTNVLVVDDQPYVRQILERVLTAAGYAVRAVADGRSALEAVRTGAPVDILVTDLAMPTMSGRDLVQQLRDTLDIKVLYVSGRTDAPEARPSSFSADRAFLGKPFSRAQLLEAIHALLAPATDALSGQSEFATSAGPRADSGPAK